MWPPTAVCLAEDIILWPLTHLLIENLIPGWLLTVSSGARARTSGRRDIRDGAITIESLRAPGFLVDLESRREPYGQKLGGEPPVRSVDEASWMGWQEHRWSGQLVNPICTNAIQPWSLISRSWTIGNRQAVRGKGIYGHLMKIRRHKLIELHGLLAVLHLMQAHGQSNRGHSTARQLHVVRSSRRSKRRVETPDRLYGDEPLDASWFSIGRRLVTGRPLEQRR